MLAFILQATMNAFMRYCNRRTLGLLQQMAAAAFLSGILMRRPGRVSAGTYDVREVLSTQDRYESSVRQAATDCHSAMLAFVFQA